MCCRRDGVRERREPERGSRRGRREGCMRSEGAVRGRGGVRGETFECSEPLSERSAFSCCAWRQREERGVAVRLGARGRVCTVVLCRLIRVRFVCPLIHVPIDSCAH